MTKETVRLGGVAAVVPTRERELRPRQNAWASGHTWRQMSTDQLTEFIDSSSLVKEGLRLEKPARRARRVPRTWTAPTFLVDLGTVTLATALTMLLQPSLGISTMPAAWALAVPIIVLAVFRLRGTYGRRLSTSLLDDLRLVLAATAISAMAVTSLRVATSDEGYVAAQEIWQWILTAGLIAVGRVSLFIHEDRLRRAGQLSRPTLIIGAGTVGHLIARRLLKQPELGLDPIGFLDKEPLAGEELPVLGASWDLERVIEEHGVEHVIVTFSTAPHHVMLRIARTCEELRVGVHLVPRLFENITDRVTVEHLGGLPLISVQRSDPKGWQVALKYGLDRVLAALALFVCAPVIGLAAIGVLVAMGRPVFFAQPRVGRDGRRFTLLKFRSMQPESEGGDASDEERVTPFGRFLRRSAIDELPQLLNVLKGEMSLIGPRPERPELVDVFEQQVYRYDARHRVKSGITGWAQVHGIGRGDQRFAHATLADRVEWDNYYIENWSPWLDFKIALLTPLAVMRFSQR
jgi:exopolysaccharide biosynthesis polyprenyl glycosylphosphotransferase